MPAELQAAPPQGQKPWALKALPPFPAVALQLLSLLDNPDVPLKKIVDLLRVDPALSGELLRVANSALYGFVQRIDSVKHAVVVLGSENVKRLALTVSLSKVAKGFLRYENLRPCWDHVIASAMLSEELALQLGMVKDRAYTAGLLHDIGRLAMLVCYPVEYGNLLGVAHDENFDELECERQMFDIDHCAAGRWLADHWNLPADIAGAIALHHEGGQLDSDLAQLVRCACQLADSMGFGVRVSLAGRPIAELLTDLPLKDPAQTAADLETASDRIRQALGTIDSSNR